MYESLFQKAEGFFKPASDVFDIQTKTLDALREQQLDFAQTLLNDSLDLAKGVAEAGASVDALMATQQKYWDGLRDKINSNVQSQCDLLADAQDKLTVMWQSLFDAQTLVAGNMFDLTGSGAEVSPKATVKSAVAPTVKKASAKKSAKAPGKTAANPKLESPKVESKVERGPKLTPEPQQPAKDLLSEV